MVAVELGEPGEGVVVGPLLAASHRTEPDDPVLVEPGGAALGRHSKAVNERVVDDQNALLTLRCRWSDPLKLGDPGVIQFA